MLAHLGYVCRLWFSFLTLTTKAVDEVCSVGISQLLLSLFYFLAQLFKHEGNTLVVLKTQTLGYTVLQILAMRVFFFPSSLFECYFSFP